MSILNSAIRWSLKNQWLVFLLALVLLAYGVRTASVTPVDVFPDFSPVKVDVVTESPGFAPPEVESLVTRPLEYALGGTAKMATIRSLSTVGLSVVSVIFEDGVDVFTARQLVQERVQAARGKIAAGAGEPQLAPIATITGDILKIGFIPGGKTSLMDLRTIADWTIRNRLMAVPGVSNVVTYGGDLKQYQVLVDPNKLRDYNLSLDEVVRSAQMSNTNAAGGVLRQEDREFLIRGIGRASNVADIAGHVVAVREGTPITISQVAKVTIGPAFKTGDAVINGKPAVLMNVVKQPWANTLTTTQLVEKAVQELSSSLPKDVTSTTVFRQADFIEVAIHNVLEALALGGVLVAFVLFGFLRNWRTAVISLTAIPLSLLTAVVALNWLGGTINTMTLAGLAIAIGEVVDDAIIDVENVHRRLRERDLSSADGDGLWKVVYEASREIRTSVVYATFIVCLVFLPVFSLGGLEGKIFAPLAMSYIVSIMASLVVALTVTPAMCNLLLARGGNGQREETSFVRWLKTWYGRVLSLSLAHPKVVIRAAATLFVISLVPLMFVGKEFLPEFDESNLVVSVTSMPGTSLSLTTQMGQSMTGHLLQDKGVFAAGQRAGRAEGSDDYVGSNSSEIDIRLLTSAATKEEQLKHVREDFAQIPGALVSVGSYIRHRMDHALSGVNAAIAIKVFGPDLPVLHEKARQIESVLKSVGGVVDAQVEPIVPIPDISIEVDRQAAGRYGVAVGDLANSIESAFRGRTVSQVLEGQQSFSLFVWFEPRFRDDIETIQETLVDTPSGIKVPIGSLAQIKYGISPNTIRHEMISRLVVVQANVSGRDLGSVIADVRKLVGQKVILPAGYYVIYGGQFEAQEEATSKLVMMTLFSFAGIFALLTLAFRSPITASLVMFNLPLALLGGVWAVVFSGGVLSIGSLLGFITLFGLSTRNGIMLVSHFIHLRRDGMAMDDVLFKGSLDRVVPVLMTALTAAIGVLPIAIMGGAGRELEQPLAIVILGGMISSTGLTLVVIPALFKLMAGRTSNLLSLSKEADS